MAIITDDSFQIPSYYLMPAGEQAAVALMPKAAKRAPSPFGYQHVNNASATGEEMAK